MRSSAGVNSHTQLQGVTANQHHPQLHASEHDAAAGDPFLHAADHEFGAGDALVGYSPADVLRKAVTETVTSTTLQNDDDFSFAIGANEIWAVEIEGPCNVLAAEDLQLTFAGPAGMTIAVDTMEPQETRKLAAGSAQGTTLTTGAAATISAIKIRSTIVNGGTAGTVNFQWAQGTFGGTGVSLEAGMVMHRTRIA